MYRSPAEFHTPLEDEPDPANKLEHPAGASASLKRNHQPVRYMIWAVVQVQDLRPAVNAIEQLGLSVTHLPSTGAFLGRRNVTLVIPVPDGLESQVIDAIRETCHQRVEYVSTPLEGAPMPIPLSTPITVGGASVFSVEVERYEEF